MRVTQSTDQTVAVVPYSSGVQQPMRATAVLGRCPQMRWTAPEDREQGRAGSLHPEGQCFVDQTWTEHGADFPD